MKRDGPQRVLEWLRQHGRIRPLEAWVRLGIYRVADPIERLREKGHKIHTQMVSYKRPDGRVVQFGEYILIKERK